MRRNVHAAKWGLIRETQLEVGLLSFPIAPSPCKKNTFYFEFQKLHICYMHVNENKVLHMNAHCVMHSDLFYFFFKPSLDSLTQFYSGHFSFLIC